MLISYPYIAHIFPYRLRVELIKASSISWSWSIIDFKAIKVSFDEKTQRVTLTFGEKIPVSESAILQLEYAGTMNNSMAGFYRSRYKPLVAPARSVARDDEFHYMFSTQFESSDARKALPCFDEPNLKATFDLKIEIPNDQVALSNMPEIGTQPGQTGRKIVSFARTPLMSTYVCVLKIGCVWIYPHSAHENAFVKVFTRHFLTILNH